MIGFYVFIICGMVAAISAVVSETVPRVAVAAKGISLVSFSVFLLLFFPVTLYLTNGRYPW